jgi:hypothetical protein
MDQKREGKRHTGTRKDVLNVVKDLPLGESFDVIKVARAADVWKGSVRRYLKGVVGINQEILYAKPKGRVCRTGVVTVKSAY